MADAVLTIDAEVQAAVAKLKQVNDTLLSVVSTVKGAAPIYDAYGNQANAALQKIDTATQNTSKSTSVFESTLGKLNTAIKNPTATMTSMATSFAAGYLSMAALQTAGQALLGFLSDSVSEFTNAEAASKKLNVALQNQGQEVPKVRAYYDALGQQFQRTTVYSSGLITEMQTLLTQVGNVAPSEMKKALQASADLSAGLGIDLKAATTMVAKAFSGGGEELGKLKQILGDTVPEGASMSQVLDAINQKFGGQAQAEMATYAGQVKQLGNEFANAKEDIGRTLHESGLLTLGVALTKEAIKQLSDKVKELSGVLNWFSGAQTTAAKSTAAVTTEFERNLSPAEKLARANEEMRVKMEGLRTEAQKLKGDALKPLSAENKELALSFNASSKSAEWIAEKLGVSAAAVSTLIDTERRATDETKRATDELNRKSAERHQALERIRLLTVDVTDKQREQILSNYALGASETDIAKALRINEVQVGKVIEAEKERKKTAEDVSKAIAKFEEELAKATAKASQQTRERIQADGVARLEQASALHTVLVENERKLELAQTTGLQRRLLELKYAEQDEIASLHKKHDATEESTKKVEALIRKRYQGERDQAVTTATSIVERMRDQGVYTRAEQETTVASLKSDYERMKASGQYTYAELEAAERRWRDASNEMSNQGVKRFLGNMDDMLNMAAAFASGVGGKFGEVAGKVIGVAKDVGSMASSFASGDWIGGTIKALGLLGKAVGAIFPGNETKKAREEFAAGMDLTLDQLMKKLQSMGAKGQELANTALNVIGKHDEAGNKRWMNEVTAFFTSHQQQLEDERSLIEESTLSWEQAEDLVKKYGIATTNSGKALEQSKLNDQSKDLAAEWRKLVLAGLDVTDVTTGMADETQVYLDRARSMGLEIPEAMRAPLEKMIELGLLTDANGDKMKDLGGIRFSETPVDRLVKKLDELLSKIFGIGDSAEDAKKKTNKAFNDIGDEAGSVSERIHKTLGGLKFEIPLTYGELPELPGGGGGAGGSEGGVPAFSKGSDGIRDFGPRTLAWLHGREGVFTQDQINAIVMQAGRFGVGAVPSVASGMTFASGASSQGAPIIINAPVDASGSMFQDRRAMTDLAEIVSERIAAKYRGSFPVGVR